MKTMKNNNKPGGDVVNNTDFDRTSVEIINRTAIEYYKARTDSRTSAADKLAAVKTISDAFAQVLFKKYSLVDEFSGKEMFDDDDGGTDGDDDSEKKLINEQLKQMIERNRKNTEKISDYYVGVCNSLGTMLDNFDPSKAQNGFFGYLYSVASKRENNKKRKESPLTSQEMALYRQIIAIIERVGIVDPSDKDLRTIAKNNGLSDRTDLIIKVWNLEKSTHNASYDEHFENVLGDDAEDGQDDGGEYGRPLFGSLATSYDGDPYECLPILEKCNDEYLRLANNSRNVLKYFPPLFTGDYIKGFCAGYVWSVITSEDFRATIEKDDTGFKKLKLGGTPNYSFVMSNDECREIMNLEEHRDVLTVENELSCMHAPGFDYAIENRALYTEKAVAAELNVTTAAVSKFVKANYYTIKEQMLSGLLGERS